MSSWVLGMEDHWDACTGRIGKVRTSFHCFARSLMTETIRSIPREVISIMID